LEGKRGNRKFPLRYRAESLRQIKRREEKKASRTTSSRRPMPGRKGENRGERRKGGLWSEPAGSILIRGEGGKEKKHPRFCRS